MLLDLIHLGIFKDFITEISSQSVTSVGSSCLKLYNYYSRTTLIYQQGGSKLLEIEEE